MFDSLSADWFHQLQNFLQTFSIQEQLKKQWSKVSTTELQKAQFIEFKVIPRFVKTVHTRIYTREFHNPSINKKCLGKVVRLATKK